MLKIQQNHLIFLPKYIKIEMVDPRAAGDAFIGAFCTRICTDDSIGKVLSIANYTAALSIATEGAIESLPTSKQVREYMEQKRDA